MGVRSGSDQTWKKFQRKCYKKKTSISFTNYKNQIQLPFIIYVHFESLRVPPRSKRNSKLIFVHKPCGFSYSIKSSDDESLSKYKAYFGENCVEVFWKLLEEDAKELGRMLQETSTNSSLTEAMRRAIPNFIPVVMCNFSKYGGHFISQSSETYNNLLLDSENNFIYFTRKLENIELRFLDSSKFLTKLEMEELVEILDDDKKIRLKREFKKQNEFNLMKTVGCFPHNHVISFQQFAEEKLPGMDGFYDKLKDAEITHASYNWAKNVWTTFKCKTLLDFFYLFVKSNVLMLEDVFENFRSLCLDKYELDPAQYSTIASLSWDAMLKCTEVELPILQDPEMIKFIKSNIRGGINHCSKRCAKANNKYHSIAPINQKNPSTFIVYLDANNSAGFAMSQYLPCGEFSWLTGPEIESLSKAITSLKSDDDYGYIFEVDLNYPQELHDLHNDLPFCCERLTVPPPPVSPEFSGERSTMNLYNKRHYVIDYRNLQQCLANKLELIKIYRVLKFRQRQWLKPYVTYNTKLRADAENDFEINLYKLLNNSVYGKTIQKSSFDKPSDKPIYAGFCTLELQKHLMYDFHYNRMLKKYKKENVNLLYTDTDGFIYEIKTNDFYQDLKDDPVFLECFDTSNISAIWNIPFENKKVVGKMKDECDGKIIREFYGVGSRVYCLDVDGEEVKKARGVPKYIKMKHVSKHDFEECVLRDKLIERKVLSTSASKHQVQTTQSFRKVLSPGDTKRCILPDKVNTLAWGFVQNKTTSKGTHVFFLIKVILSLGVLCSIIFSIWIA